jgi:Protein of unknown function (DUF4058)
MPSPFPGMDPFLEKNPIFHELYTQILAHAQARLQTQLRPKYIARLERHLSEGSVWTLGVESLDRKEPDIAIMEGSPVERSVATTATLAEPTVRRIEDLDPEELELRKQRRIVIYVNTKPRLAVTSIELLSPSNKAVGSIARDRYLEKRSSALHGGLHWVEIDLLRGGARPPIPVDVPENADYLAYVAQATLTGWDQQIFSWGLRDPIPTIPIPLLGSDRAGLDIGACFQESYDAIAADDEAGYDGDPPPPSMSEVDLLWVDDLLRRSGLRD